MSAEVETIALGSVAEVKGGKRLPKGSSLQQTPNNHPYLRIVDFVSGGVNQSNLLYVPDSVYSTISRYVVEPEDVFISIVGTIGVVGIIPDNLRGANLTENAARIRVNCDVYNPRFLMYFLMSPKGQEQINSLTVGSTQPKLALFRIQEIQVPSIPIGDQLKIVSILNTLDRCIENFQCQNITLEALAQTLFRSWFVNFDPVHAKAAGQTPEGISPELAALFPSEFLESELGRIPKGFSFAPIKSLMGVEYGKNLPTKQLTDSGYPVFGGNGQIGYFSKFLFEDKRVVIACRGAASGKINFTKPFSFVTNNSLVLSPDAAKGWSFEFTKYTMLNQDLIDYVTGSAQPQLTIESLSALKLLAPPNELTTQFSKIINPLESAFDNNQELINCLGSLRDELLPRLISGKLRIEEAEEAVSEVLGSTAEEEKAA